MNVILTRPRYHSHLITPPLGMGYVCAYMRKNGIATTIIDGLKENIGNNLLAARCARADSVGIFCMSAYLHAVIDLTARLKQLGKIVCIGGPHATVMPRQTLEVTGADYAIVGEGEQSLTELVLALGRGENGSAIAGVLGKGQSTLTARPFFKSLDELPFPAWDQINPRTYPKAPHGGVVRKFPVAPVISTRGCPFSCSFCASPRIWRNTIRFRSAPNVVDEIEMLVRDFSVREIHFEDDNFTLKEEHAVLICEEILRRKLNICWALPNGIRVDAVAPPLLRLMRRAGCYSVAFGIESGSQKILDNIGKKTDLARMRAAITMAARAGLITQAFIIFGLPGETAETIKETMDFVMAAPLHKAQFLLLDVLPGSALWDELGPFDISYFNKRSYQEAGFIPQGLTAEYLAQARSRAFRRFHLRPRQLFTLLRLAKIGQVKTIARRLKDFSMLDFGKG
ncbi:MAG: radical SAM protein [Chitinivibrionales bacterium]|nr:radical SAM protein [Chitinivibrionales bacterium]